MKALRVGILHRFSVSGIDNSYPRPVTFYEGKKDILHQPERHDPTVYKNPQQQFQQGKGYMDSDGQLVETPFDFSEKNWMSLQDMHDMLKAVMLPASVPAYQRFDLSEEDYRFLYRWMSATTKTLTSLSRPLRGSVILLYACYNEDGIFNDDHIVMTRLVFLFWLIWAGRHMNMSRNGSGKYCRI